MISYKEGIEKLDRLLDKQHKYQNIDDVYKDISDIKDLLKSTRNELCLYCGKYKNEHEGWCEGCNYGH